MAADPYAEFLAEREEVMRHKWLMSEHCHCDVGLEKALVDWAMNHRAEWRHRRNQSLQKTGKVPISSTVRN